MTLLLRALPASTAEMIGVFSDIALLRAALDFEAALAEAQQAEFLMPADHAALIQSCCAAENFDMAGLAEAAAYAGTLAIPLVAELRRQVTATSDSAASLVHLGATSQDLADTALMLQAKQGLALIERDVSALRAHLAALARRYAKTPMLGRTLLQGALPITFGLKIANWLGGIDAAAARLSRESQGALALQFGGAAGTRAGLGGKGAAVASRMAANLGLADPVLPWHAQRDRVANLGVALAILTGGLGKMARDIALLAQGEVAEVFEPRAHGRGGSSTMAHNTAEPYL